MNGTVRSIRPSRRARRSRWRRRIYLGVGLVAVACAALTFAAPAWVLAKASVLEYALCRRLAPGTSRPASPLVIAHRGHLTDEHVCENSEASIAAALAAGYSAIEIDVSFTRDLVPVLFHDDALARLTGRAGTLGDLSSSELQRVRLRDGQPILTLADFWQRLADRFTLVCIDVKGSEQCAAARARALSQALPARVGMPRVIVIGVPYQVLRETIRLRPEVSYACEAFGVVANRLVGFDAVSASLDKFSPGQVRLARTLGMTYVVWTLNTPEQVAAAEAAGVDAYITDGFAPLGR
jgi:glycerophosphoryl diester phosphodiesterase